MHFGLIGISLKHSFSKSYFEIKFKNLNLKNYTYELFEIHDSEDLAHFIATKAKTLKGFNVTFPYKEKIIDFLDILDSDAQKIGAVNVVTNENGLLKGYNTDFYGFTNSIKPYLNETRKKALVLGTGGAAKAVIFGLNLLQIEYILVSRNKSNTLIYNQIDKDLLNDFHIIINTTPLGTFPDIENFPPIPFEFLNKNHLVFDLVYNPEKTTLLKKAAEKDCTILNGMKMLELQAEKAWEIWNKR